MNTLSIICYIVSAYFFGIAAGCFISVGVHNHIYRDKKRKRENTMTEGDKIFKFLQKCNRQSHTPDLHSFKAKIEKGTVWVECRGFEVFIESRTYNNKGFETVTPWAGSTIAAANRLELLKMDFNTIDMRGGQTMTKAQLRDYKALRLERDTIARLIVELEEVIYSPKAQQLHGMPRNGSGAPCPTENLALKHMELVSKYQETVEQLAAQMAEIEDAIQVLDPRERTIIRLHYFQGLPWEQVAVETGYTGRHVHRLHGKALERLQSEEAEA